MKSVHSFKKKYVFVWPNIEARSSYEIVLIKKARTDKVYAYLGSPACGWPDTDNVTDNDTDNVTMSLTLWTMKRHYHALLGRGTNGRKADTRFFIRTTSRDF